MPYHIIAAEGIRLAESAFRIIAPLTVHEETIVMCPLLQLDYSPPHAIQSPLQVDGTCLPLRKVANQLHAKCAWRAEREGLFPGVAAAFHHFL